MQWFWMESKSLVTIILLLLLTGCASTSAPPAVERHSREPGIPAKQTQQVARFISAGEKAAAVASQQIGVPYRYGGTTPRGFDCSGLVHYAYAKAGVSVPRTTGQLWSASRTLARSELKTGDLLFFRVNGKMSHVGMYLGRDRFVHAPSSGKVVSVQSLDNAYYQKAFIRGGRL